MTDILKKISPRNLVCWVLWQVGIILVTVAAYQLLREGLQVRGLHVGHRLAQSPTSLVSSLHFRQYLGITKLSMHIPQVLP